MELLDGLLPLTLAFNRGAAFGISIGNDPRWFFIPVTILAMGLLAVLFVQSETGDRVKVLSISLILSGALGNLVDRVRWDRGVVDFIGPIDLGFMHWPIFNVADSAITCGAVLLGISFWREERARAREGEGGERVGGRLRPPRKRPPTAEGPSGPCGRRGSFAPGWSSPSGAATYSTRCFCRSSCETCRRNTSASSILVSISSAVHVLAQGVLEEVAELADARSFEQVVGQGVDAHLLTPLRGQVVDVHRYRIRARQLVLDAFQAGGEHDREGQVRVAGGIREAQLDAGGDLLAGLVHRDADGRRPVALRPGDVDRRFVAGHQAPVGVVGRVGDQRHLARVLQHAGDEVAWPWRSGGARSVPS